MKKDKNKNEYNSNDELVSLEEMAKKNIVEEISDDEKNVKKEIPVLTYEAQVDENKAKSFATIDANDEAETDNSTEIEIKKEKKKFGFFKKDKKEKSNDKIDEQENVIHFEEIENDEDIEAAKIEKEEIPQKPTRRYEETTEVIFEEEEIPVVEVEAEQEEIFEDEINEEIVEEKEEPIEEQEIPEEIVEEVEEAPQEEVEAEAVEEISSNSLAEKTEDSKEEIDDIFTSLVVEEAMPVEYAKSTDDLPVAQKSDDVYADIVKNLDDELEEKTSRRVKYENEQSFVDSENPFQRDRDAETPDEENLSYEEINRKELKTFDEMLSGIKKKLLPQNGEKKSAVIRKIVSNVSVVVLIGCAIAFGVIFVQSRQATKQQMGLSSQIVDITSAEEEEQLWEEFRAKYPNIKTPEGMMAKYAYLYALNQQLVGWISIPNSGIDVQVVQSANNKDYLKKDFYGNYSRYGCPFMDYRNDARYLNQNTIIYGHHMSDGLIFAELSKYKELKGFLESPIICFDTLYKPYYFKVYAAFITNTREEDDNGYIFNYTVTSFASTQNFDAYISAIDERKLYTTGVDINSGDKLITLSTCTYEFNDARFVVIGRMLRTGETVDIDTTYATTNGNPHYPQVWYDKNGKTNPYAGATRWYPEG